MALIFMEGRVNFPTDESTFNARLKEIRKLINNDDNVADVNVEFVKTTFKFMEDCGLITGKIANSLTDAGYCEQFRIKCPFKEGVLRAVRNDDDVLDENGARRFYSGATSSGTGNKMHVQLLNGQHYLISNHWFAGDYGNKANFVKWLEANAKIAWEKNKSAEKNSATAKNFIMIPANELRFLTESIKNLTAKVDNLTTQVEELKNKFYFIK